MLAGVTLTLNGVDTAGNPVASQITTTGSDGTYLFSNVAAGTYTITEAQPKKIADGMAIAGSLGGSVAKNMLTGIVMSSGGIGSGYDFAENGLDMSMISSRLFLASTPPVQQILADAISQYGLAAPIVTSIAKTDSDPTTATSVSYIVSFNESVTGVDAGDFAVYGNASAQIESVSGSGNSYTVTVTTGGGTGSVGIGLVDDDTVMAADGTPLGGAGTGNGNFVGPSYTTSGETVSVAIASATDPINASNESNVAANGTGEVGATISLTASDGDITTVEYTTVVGEDGTWSIAGIDVSSLADGTITFMATATDAEGNTAQGSRTSTKDTVAHERCDFDRHRPDQCRQRCRRDHLGHGRSGGDDHRGG